MNKAELLTAVQSKKGFVRIVVDEKAPDSDPRSTTEKRYLVVEHTNTDGTAGMTNVYYLHDTVNDVAKFYNAEPSAFDINEPPADLKKRQALETYLKGKYAAFFLGRIDLVNLWAEADVFVQAAGKLTKKSVLVYKPANGPIADVDVTSV